MKDLEEIQKLIDKIMIEQNNRELPDFEGYSSVEMYYILYNTFDKQTPVQLHKLTEDDYKKIPILNQIKYLLGIIENKKELKLTKKGFLPTKIVSEIYNQGFIKEYYIELGVSKLYKETDSRTLNLTRILVELSGIVKKRKGKLSFTKKGQSIFKNDFELLLLILKTFGNKFNWAYYDAYGQNSIGQYGFGFSLILLSKFGNEKRLDKFYSDKYFKAFPQLIQEIQEPNFRSKKELASKCYSLRTFDRFLDYFGLIKIETETKEKWDTDKYITRTNLFDKLIKVIPHNNQYGGLGRMF